MTIGSASPCGGRPGSGELAGETDTSRRVNAAGGLSESGRVEAFSDGVLAIVITLLVLELHAPDQRNEILRELLDQWPAYVAYLASFGYVGVVWVNHHQLFTRIAAVDTGLLWRNLLLLLATSVLPFPTAVLGRAYQHGSHDDQVVGMVLYVLVAAAMAATWLVLFQYLTVHPRLLVKATPDSFFSQEQRRALVGIGLYLLAALVALWQPLAGLVVACALPVFYGATSGGWSPRLSRRGRR